MYVLRLMSSMTSCVIIWMQTSVMLQNTHALPLLPVLQSLLAMYILYCMYTLVDT